MSRDYSILVCGLGRCGTSLVMQMLDSAGVPTTGAYPAFEDARYATSPRRRRPPLGAAVKVLDPHRFPPREGRYRCIWIDREPQQQARSQMKFASVFFGGLRVDEESIDRVRLSLSAERHAALEVLRRLQSPVLPITFEDLISDAATVSEKIGAFLDIPDAARMASCVIPRGAECLPGLLELEQIAQREPNNQPAREEG